MFVLLSLCSPGAADKFLLFVSLAKVTNTGSLVTGSVAVNIWNVNIRMYIFMGMSYETGRQRSRCWLGGITSDSCTVEKFRFNDNEFSYYNRSWVYVFLCFSRMWLLI